MLPDVEEEEPAVSPEVESYLSQDGGGDDDPEPSPEVKAYLARAGITTPKKPVAPKLGEPPTGPSHPRPQHGGEGSAQTPGHGTSRDFTELPLLQRLWKGLNEGDQAPDQHLDLGAPPPDATFESTADFARERRQPPPALTPRTAQSDATKVTPIGSPQQKAEALEAPQHSRAEAARSMRETAKAAKAQADSLRAAGKTDEADALDRQSLNADKTAYALEQTAGPMASFASALGQTLPFVHDPYEQENRTVREASTPGAVPTPKEQVQAGVQHPGPPRVAPALTSPEGASELAGQIPAFELYGELGGAGGELLGKLASAAGKAAPAIQPATEAITSGMEKLRAAAEIPAPVGPRVPMSKLPAAAFKDEAAQILDQLKPRLTRGLTQGAEGVFGTSYAAARSQGATREDALKAALESIPANIPFAMGMEALGAVSGPLARIGKAGAEVAGRAAMETGGTEASPMVQGMRQVRDSRQIPNVPGAKTPFDAPDVIAARAQGMGVSSTHLDESPERQAWRTEAQKTHFENAKLYAPNGQPAAGHQAWIVIGGPGTGKSSIIRDFAEKGQAMVTDADDAKRLTPELQANPNMAWAVHLETGKINAKVIKQAVKQGLNFVWPTVGMNATDLGQRIHELKGAGYDVHLSYVHAPAAVAAQRVVDRWRSGKQGFIDPANVLALRGVSQATFGKLAKHSDIAGYEEYDNSVNGRPPRLVRSSDTDRAAQASPAVAPAGTSRIPGSAPSGDGRAGVGTGLLGQLGQAASATPAGEVAPPLVTVRGGAQLDAQGGPHLEDATPEGARRATLAALDDMQSHEVYSKGTRSPEDWATLTYTESGSKAAADHIRALLKDKGDLSIDQVRHLVEPGDDTLIGRWQRLAAEDRARRLRTDAPAGQPIAEVPPISPMGNVELTSENAPGLTGKELDQRSPKMRRAGLNLFINKVVRPIVRSEGLPDHVTKGLGSWFSQGSLALHEGGTVRFPDDVKPDQVHRVLARISQAAQQNGYFAAIPDAHGDRLAIELDFGQALSPKELSSAVERLSRADGGRRFNGSTMRDLSPARVQIVLNEGATKADAAQLLDLAHQTLAEPGDTGPTGRFRGLAYSATVADGFDPAKFSQVVADRGGLSGSQVRADKSARLWYKALATASRTIGKAGELAQDLHHATAPHQSLALDALGKYGVFLPPLAAAALPGNDEDKAKRFGLASAGVFLAPRFRRQILENLEKNPTDGYMSADSRAPAETWVQRLTTDFDHTARAKVRAILGTDGGYWSADEVRARIEGAKAPERQVPLVSRLRKWLTQTPADSPRALGKAWDEPRPVADWINKIQNGASQAGVKKDEIQLLVSALKGESTPSPKQESPLAAFDKVVEQQDGVTRDRNADDWAYLTVLEMYPHGEVGERGRVVDSILRAINTAGGTMVSPGRMRQLLEEGYKNPEEAPVPSPVPAKLTRADVLKLLDEKLPKVERVVLHKGEKETPIDDALPQGRADQVLTMPVVQHLLAERTPGAPGSDHDSSEDFIREQIANRKAAQVDLNDSLRRLSPEVENDDYNADPDALIEAHGWDPTTMEAHIDVRARRIKAIEREIDEKIEEAENERDNLSNDDDNERDSLQGEIGRRAKERVYAILNEGWDGDGFTRDAIDDAVQAAQEDIEPPDYDPEELLKDNGYRVEPVEPEWVFSPHKHQGVLFGDYNDDSAQEGSGDITYTPREIQEFLAEEHNRQLDEDGATAHGTGTDRGAHLDPEDFDPDDITREDAFRLFRRDHGDLTAKLVKHDPEEFVIVNPKGEVQKVSWGQNPREYRGDDERALINDFISDRSLDESLNDERMDEVANAVRRAARVFSKWKEAEDLHYRMENDADYDNTYFRSEREEIGEHEQAIAKFEEARDNPTEPPVAAGDRAEKVGELTKQLHGTIAEIGRLKELGTKAREERKRLGSGKRVPESQGVPHYDGTQVSPGPREDYTELIPIWANAPVKGRTPPETHFSGEGYPEDIGHARASTHLHYEIPGLGPEGFTAIDQGDARFFEKKNLNDVIADRRTTQQKLAELTAKMEPFDRIGLDALTAAQREEATELAQAWRRQNDRLEALMKREARQLTDIAEQSGLKPIRIRILEENQNDPAQQAAGRGVKTEGSLRSGVPPNPFMRGGTVEKKGTSKAGDEEVRYDVDGELGYRLNAINFLADAVERDENMIGWQDADTASAVHSFRRKAAKHVYEEVTPSAIRDGLRFAGIPEKEIPKPEHMMIAGAGHWVMRLTPEIKAAIKKVGLPIMGLLTMAAMPRSAKAQSPNDEEAETPSSNLPVWLATGIGAAIGLAALAWARKAKGGVEKYPTEIQDLLDETDSILAKRRAMRDRSGPGPLGEGYKAAFDTAETPDGKGPAFYNVGKLGLSTEGEKLWRGVVGDPGLKRRISQETGVEVARVRALDPDRLLIKDKWDAIDNVAGRMFIAQATDRLVDMQSELDTGKFTPEERQAKVANYARLAADLADVSEKATKERQEAGRTLNFYKIAVKAIGFDQASWAMLARRAKGEPLDSREISRIIDLLKSQDKLELAAYVNGLRPTDLGKRIAEGIRLGMLSSWTTLEKITASHLISELRRIAQHPLAVGLDYLMAAGGATLKGGSVTDRRTMALAVKGQMAARAEGAARGWRQAKETLRAGTTEEDIGRLDTGRVNFKSPFMRGVQRLIYGMHSLGYAPFREAEFEAVYRELAMVEAKKLHRLGTGESVTSIHNRLLATTPPELVSRAMEESRRISYAHKSSTLRRIPLEGDMLDKAAEEADIAVFQDKDSLLGAIARGARRGAESSGVGAIGSAFIFPFSTIPANIAIRLVDSTPLGIATAAIRQLGHPFDQRRLAQDLAYTLSGSTGMLWLGYVLYHKGILSGLPPTDQKQGRLERDEGKQPLSIKLGDNWYSLSDIGPEGMTLALGAAWYQALEEEPSLAKALGRETGAIGAVIASAPFLSGIKEATDAMSDPIRHGESFIKSMAQALVPASVRRVAHAADPKLRETDGPVEQIESSLPGVSKRLPERLTQFGEPQTRTTGERMAEVLSPVRIKHQSTDPVYQELDRLRVGLPNSRTKVYEAGKSRPTTPEERHAETTSTGPILKRAYEATINNPRYADLPDETKRALLEKVSLLPADALRYVGNHRRDNTAPTDLVERKVQSDLRRLVGEAVSEAGTGVRRLERTPRPSASLVAPGTPVSPEVAAYLRQQRQDARRRPVVKTP